MASDAHAHPRDLESREPDQEARRRRAGVPCAASSWNEEEFLYHEALSRRAAADGAPPLLLCFGAHPQLPAGNESAARRAVEYLERLCAEQRLAAIGEMGFDLFDDAFKASFTAQEELFEAQLALAERYSLPLVLHLRRAMHLAFSYSRRLSRLPSVVFHSYNGTLGEAQDFLKRGCDAYFSFGNIIALNHRKAMEACARLPLDRLLTETDAPYQPLRGRDHSTWTDLEEVVKAGAALRAESGNGGGESGEFEAAADANFRRAFGLDA